jgi:hypothetical protein
MFWVVGDNRFQVVAAVAVAQLEFQPGRGRRRNFGRVVDRIEIGKELRDKAASRFPRLCRLTMTVGCLLLLDCYAG